MGDPGSYLLVIECEQPIDIAVGALGQRSFAAGHYAYAGSAFGPGGLARVDRHRRIDAGDHEVRHWHIDYLLGAADTELVAVETFLERDLECELATALAAAGYDNTAAFGASDCDCPSHLWGPADRSALLAVAASLRE